MDVQILLMLALQASIFATMLTIGMATSGTDLRYLLSQPSRLVRSLLAMNVLWPAVVIIVCRTFSLHPAEIVALVTMSIAPVSNMFTKSMLPLVGPGRGAYAHGLFFASTVLSIVLTPLAVEVINAIFGGEQHVSPRIVAQVVIGNVLLPLGIGLAIGRWWPASTRWIPAIQKVSGLVLLACALVIVAATWSLMGSLYREGTVTAIVLIVLAGLAVGHVLGGPDEDDRTVLAHATVSRHPGVAEQLIGFARIDLEPRESKTVRFVVPMSVLGYTGLSGDFVIEPGPVELSAGSSSSDIRCNATLTITGVTRVSAGEDRAFLSVANVDGPATR
jgi:BASS family bile acid:Na+ symporter